jgi:hypothetical protein
VECFFGLLNFYFELINYIDVGIERNSYVCGNNSGGWSK